MAIADNIHFCAAIGGKQMKVLNLFLALILTFLFAGVTSVSAQSPKRTAGDSGEGQQPIFSEYKGIRLGMTAVEVRATLGEPTIKSDDQDYYVLSESEAVQVVYDAQLKTRAISIDYMGGVGAPDPKTIVGGEQAASPGGFYRVMRYDNLGFWVSYNRTAGPVVMVSITIQKIRPRQ
jgi:outer membrane protein assembly factor BamE (lipoprotein component of BamABCDE complex)